MMQDRPPVKVIKTNSSYHKKIVEIDIRIKRIATAAVHELDEDGLEDLWDEMKDVLASIIGVPVASLNSCKAVENAIMQYAAFIASHCQTLRGIHVTEGSYTYTLPKDLFSVNYSFLTKAQRDEIVQIYNTHYPDVACIVFLDPFTIRFNRKLLFQSVLRDMLLNEAFQEHLATQRLMAKFADVWRENELAENNVVRLLDKIRHSYSFFPKTEEVEAKKIRDTIKDGSNLYVFKRLLELKKSPLSDHAYEVVTFALLQLKKNKQLQALWLRTTENKSTEESSPICDQTSSLKMNPSA